MRLEQDEALVTHAPKLAKDEGRLDWTLTAETLHRRIRAMHPWPGAYFDWQSPQGKTVTLGIEPGRVGQELPKGTAPGTVLGLVDGHLAIAAADKAYLTPRVTPRGKKSQDATAFACGYLKACKG
jgi:methionyl-tRNA formyltransferase